MADETGEMTVAQRLGHLLDRGLLPAGGPAEAAERLIERLERPARIALLGLPGSGKSAILNLLAGSVVVPEMLRLPTIIVQHGAEARMLCTLADGRTEIVPGGDLSHVMALNPALVTLELNLAALKVISLLEVSAGPMEAEQRRAAVWASKRADIVIWCTTSYLPKEQQVWEGMPDSVKDNGFLFLTKVDLLGSREAADGMLERVELRAGEEFRQVLSISAKQARTAMLAPGGLDREMFRDSGASSVISTIKTRVQMARRADTDMAELLLARHVEASSIVARRFAEPDPETREELPAAQPWVPPPEDVLPATIAAPVVEEPPVPDWEAELDSAAAASEPVTDVSEPEPDLMVEAELVSAVEPEPEPVENPVQDPDPANSAGSKRLSDRIRQQAGPEDAPSAPLVPLRTTWKSRTETPGPAPTPAPAKTPGPEPRPKSVPVGAASEGGPDDAAIAAMLASVAAAPTEPRVARDRSKGDVGASNAPAGAAVSSERPKGAGPQLFGARKTAAEPPVDLTSLRASAETAPATSPEASASDKPARQLRPAEPVTRIRATPEARSPGLKPADPPAPVEAVPSPRVAVLRDRRPEPAPPERRERPRIAARVATAPVAPAAPILAEGPVPATEKALLDQAISLIIARSVDLAGILDPDEKLPIDLILDHGRETTEQVIDLLSRAGSAGLRRINGDLGEVLDLIMLMQLEKGHAPADDTLTLLLQIRRDLETLRAA